MSEPIKISPETERRLVSLFTVSEQALVRSRLLKECSHGLPNCGNASPELLDRIRFAALKLSRGSLEMLDEAIELAKTDWRDLLVAAESAHDVKAHLDWDPEASGR